MAIDCTLHIDPRHAHYDVVYVTKKIEAKIVPAPRLDSSRNSVGRFRPWLVLVQEEIKRKMRLSYATTSYVDYRSAWQGLSETVGNDC
jgi:hypothetical protein